MARNATNKVSVQVFIIIHVEFLVADTHLCKRLCPSVSPSIRNDPVQKWKNKRFYILFVYVSELGLCGWGLDAPAHPSETILEPRVTCF